MEANMVNYEWDIETVDYDWTCEEPFEESDIEDHNHRGELNNFCKIDLDELDEKKTRLVLVYSDWDECEGVQERQWAYVRNEVLPEFFDGGRKVPKKYHEEFNRKFR
jgi:hypothetical protein